MGQYAYPLYPDQLEFVQGVLRLVDDCLNNRIEPVEIVYMSSRQAGKNETSARLEAHLLHLYRNDPLERYIIKSAPTYKPQLINSMNRLMAAIKAMKFWLKPRKQEGFKYWIGNACCTFLTAEPSGNRVGETASLCLECDEAQDVQPEIWRRDFEPMGNVHGVPSVFYGTAWDNDNLLETTRRHLREYQVWLSKKMGYPIKLLWETTWDIRAQHNPRYGASVQKKIDRLGDTHPIVLTQYCLKPIDSLGKFFDENDRRALIGGHQRMDGPRSEQRFYIAGVDLCGCVEADPALVVNDDSTEQRDSTVVVIGELSWRRDGCPVVRVVDMMHLTAMTPLSTERRIQNFIWEKWGCIHACVDASGVGDAVAKALEADRPNNVTAIKSSSVSVSEMGFELLGAVKTGRLTFFRSDGSEDWKQFELQVKELRREMLPSGKMRWYGPKAKMPFGPDGALVSVHDDIPKALGYLVRCADECKHLYMRYQKDFMETEVPQLQFGGY